MATRKENITRINQEKVKQTSKKIFNLLNSDKIFIYKKLNGKYNIQKIAKELNLSRNTIYHYLKIFNK